jgi:hypothetical protein
LKPKLLLCLALILSGGLPGCSSIDHHSANSKQSRPDLYLHLFASYIYPQPPRLILSAHIPLSTDFDIPMADGQHLVGRIEPRNGKFSVHFRVPLYDGTNVFNEEVELKKRYEPGPQPYDDKIPFSYQPHFVLSSNPNPKSFLKQQAAAEREQWMRKNPLTARQLAKVKRNFPFMRPGMTRDEVFSMLGLSGYQNRLFPSNPFLTRPDIRDYQLADNERLMLFFDNTGMKTKQIQMSDEHKLDAWDYASDASHRLVTQAELDMITSSSNAPSLWRTILRWP